MLLSISTLTYGWMYQSICSRHSIHCKESKGRPGGRKSLPLWRRRILGRVFRFILQPQLLLNEPLPGKDTKFNPPQEKINMFADIKSIIGKPAPWLGVLHQAWEVYLTVAHHWYKIQHRHGVTWILVDRLAVLCWYQFRMAKCLT